jgi:hydroxyacylglutathione hydrolase
MNDIYFEQVPVGNYKNFSYVAGDKSSGEAVVFDPAWSVDLLYTILEKNKLTCKYIVNTHAHFDHIDGNASLQEKTGAQIIMHESSKLKKDIGVKDGEILRVGKLELKFLHTPGHSPESICVIVNDSFLLTGDTLFIGECGRVDLPGGDPEQLYDSFEKLRSLDRDLVVYPGHDYGKTKSSTLGEQLETNYTLAKRTKEEFVKFMLQP